MIASIRPASQRMRSIPAGKTWSAADHSVSSWRSSCARAAKRFLSWNSANACNKCSVGVAL
jgi:hypothetical protein